MPPLPSALRRFTMHLASIVVLLMLSTMFSACDARQVAGKSTASPATITYRMDGPSMLPTLHVGQTLEVQSYGATQPQRGDIIAFHPPYDATVTSVKRVIALPGEKTRVDASGAVYIDGTRLNEPYLNNATNPYQPHTWTLGPEQCFLTLRRG